MTTTQLLVAGGAMVAVVFSALVCVNVCLCRRLHRSQHHQYHHQHHHQQQQQQQQQGQCGTMTSVELLNSDCRMPTSLQKSHHYTPSPTAAAAAAGGGAGTEWHCSTSDACRASPVSFCKPLPPTPSNDAEEHHCEENHYEDIDVYMVPITERMYQNGDV